MAKQKEPTYQSTSFYDKNFQLIEQHVVIGVTKQFPAIKYALLMLVAAIGIYVINFSLWPFADCINSSGFSECEWYGFSSKRDEWGQFGDFVGGLVNPFIGLLTIYLLVTTISQQSRALDQTENALDHANKALEQNETAIKQAYEALKQNSEALEITREEIKIAKMQIALNGEINERTKEAILEELEIIRNKEVRVELESMLVEFEKELNALGSKKFDNSIEHLRVNERVFIKSLNEASEGKMNQLMLYKIASGEVIDSKFKQLYEVQKGCKIVFGLLIGATVDLMPYLKTNHSKAFWQVKAVKSIEKMFIYGVIDNEHKKKLIMKVGVPPDSES